MKIIKHALLLSIAVYVAAYFIDGIHLYPAYVALVVGCVLTVINFTVKPIIKVLTLPINIITLGLFAVVVNATIFWFIGKGDLINGFKIDSWKFALYGSLIISVINRLGEKMFKSNDDTK
jgi:putative membrane protein